ncbi:mandelate racemase/muconate lactonizing enzyme family protein [Pseudonocardia nematodicida]|uniref:Mandelate racemase/muconate lactonizing enzyme family protein n=1 Tax=Pseudonocardia nematodicida TaxID=1206997 RepID=A0ABV1KG78_9PSEU
MIITKVRAHHLRGIPMQSPPFREKPDRTRALLIEVGTDEGLTGWGIHGYAHKSIVSFVNEYVAPLVVGQDPLRPARIQNAIRANLTVRHLGATLTNALSGIDVALWDIKGQSTGLSVHTLLGGAHDRIPVYITHGAAYDDAPVYSVDELAREAKHLVELGNTHIKNTVGRQAVPDPDDDYVRMAAIREAVGPDVQIAMDGNCRMTLPQTVRLCRLTEELNISFLEEPILHNDPDLLRRLRSQTTIPIAAGANHLHSAKDLLVAEAVDIIQPNVCNDAGYTAGLGIAELAEAFNVPLGHGNGSGPHNVALQAGVRNGKIIEYHFHKWMAYNAIFESTPQPENGFLTPSSEPGTGLRPRDGLVAEYEVDV